MGAKIQPPSKILYSHKDSPAIIHPGVKGTPTHISGHTSWTVEEDPNYDFLPSLLAEDSPLLIHFVHWKDGTMTPATKYGADHLIARLREWHAGKKLKDLSLPHVLSNADISTIQLNPPGEDEDPNITILGHAAPSRTQEVFDILFFHNGKSITFRLVNYKGNLNIVRSTITEAKS